MYMMLIPDYMVMYGCYAVLYRSYDYFVCGIEFVACTLIVFMVGGSEEFLFYQSDVTHIDCGSMPHMLLGIGRQLSPRGSVCGVEDSLYIIALECT